MDSHKKFTILCLAKHSHSIAKIVNLWYTVYYSVCKGGKHGCFV